jgi:cytochrome P450
MWADLDMLPLGLRTHPRYYAMGGLPGAPPGIHAEVRKLALASGFRRRALDQDAIHDAREMALRLALRRSDGRLDVRTFARALCRGASASVVCGIPLAHDQVIQVLAWFDRRSSIISRQLALISLPPVPIGPVRQLRGVLAEWFTFPGQVIERGGDGEGGLVAGLRAQLGAGRMTREEAAGYLATILFAGTEPPSQTLLWGYTHAVASAPDAGLDE